MKAIVVGVAMMALGIFGCVGATGIRNDKAATAGGCLTVNFPRTAGCDRYADEADAITPWIVASVGLAVAGAGTAIVGRTKRPAERGN